MRRLMTGLLGVSLLVAACGDDDSDDRAAVTSIPDTTTTSSTTTTEPPTVAPDVIPQDTSQITEEYVEAVLNALFEVSNEALLKTMEAGLVDEAVIELVEATTAQGSVPNDLNSLADLARAKFQGIKEQPSPLRARVVSLQRAETTCVLVEIELDRSGVVFDPPAPDPSTRTFVSLVPANEEQRDSGLNPTAWVTAEMPTTSDGTVPADGCAS